MRSFLIGATLVVVVGVGACTILLPERFAVNAPIGHMLFGRGGGAPPEDEVRERLVVPEGFSISLYADGVRNARFLRMLPTGDLLVSTPRSGQILVVERDRDGDGTADAVRPLLSDLNRPHGLDLRDGWLYVGEGDAIGRIRIDPGNGSAGSASVSGSYERIVTGIPSGGNHWSRTIRFGPDGWLYLSIGSSCNVCEEEDERRAAMLRYRPDGSEGELYATGLRNSVGFDWQPETGALYATDNGRDLLGDDFPPCELNHVERGAFYGWPYASGDRVPDPDFGKGNEERIAASRPPAHRFRAHNAPLGITFVSGEEAPEAYRGAALVALHGSWNRTKKDGYKVVSLHWDDAGGIEERDFASGFELDGDVIGRPVDVAEGPDGDFFVSDDFAGVIWRVAQGEASPAAGARHMRPTPVDTARAGVRGRASGPRTARGRLLYEEHGCASCHEATAAQEGVVVVPLADLAARYDEEAIAAFLATPTPPMPAPPLDAEARMDLAAYLLSAW